MDWPANASGVFEPRSLPPELRRVAGLTNSSAHGHAAVTDAFPSCRIVAIDVRALETIR